MPLTTNYRVTYVATYLRCGGLLITKKERFMLNLRVNIFTSVNIWKSYEQERGSLVHFFRLLAMRKVPEAITLLLVTLPKIHRF